MPPIRSTKRLDSEHQEGRILLALDAYKKGEFNSIRGAAAAFDVCHMTLSRRYKGITQRAATRANCHKLSQNEEDSLIEWIKSMDSRGLAPKRYMIKNMANFLLAERGDSVSYTIGQNWVNCFIAHTPDIVSRLSRRYDYQRAKCEDPKSIQKWFDTVQRTIIEHGITNDDIWNFDETGFAMGIISRSYIVTFSEYQESQRKILQPGNREWVTVIECINQTQAISPTVIFKAKTFTSTWFTMGPKDWHYNISENGWINDQIALDWLQRSFIPKTQNLIKGSKILLILDGHGSHKTEQFDYLCRQNNIIWLCMPAHSLYLLQPLDVGCFSIIKKAYGDLVQSKMRFGRQSIDKATFLVLYKEARNKAFGIESTIANSFAGTGLISFNPQHVLDKLTIRLNTPTPPGSSGSDSISHYTPHIPKHTKDLHRQISAINKLLNQSTTTANSSDLVVDGIKQISKGYERILHRLAISEQEISQLRIENGHIKRSRETKNKRIVYNGSLTGAEGLLLAQNKLNDSNTVSARMPSRKVNRPIRDHARSVRFASNQGINAIDVLIGLLVQIVKFSGGG
ncbi:uncharacterized protein N7469_000049 [Penicillium citrinum]|uniref:HTH CENPB-type domain-containing protein n=1 Tax=Penicillium citrinum TaxID=5077 RepID=A0A9W9PCY5_PENCI|nr:uncharacterized protein N7469_000049 [Penicillium citrinum]KAJ5241722.1 hypothetical protein N7469_000049 [Penicillium citrinum]